MAAKKGKRIPITSAKEISKQYDYDMVIVLGINEGEEKDYYSHVTTYGVNKEKCNRAGIIGQDRIGKYLGWILDDDRNKKKE